MTGPSWLSGILPERVLSQLSVARPRSTRSHGSICLLCRGGKLLCGKMSCPVLLRAQALAKSSIRITSPEICGSSPPSVFVGRIGYPKVYVGPMVPPVTGETSVLDTPELWFGRDVQEIVDFRFMLVRGKVPADVNSADSSFIRELQELAMVRTPADVEMVLERVPKMVLTLGSDIQPFGPSAPLRDFQLSSNPKTDRRIEKAYSDRDLPAHQAIVELYEQGVLISSIQRSFSLGMFGIGRQRRLVPTRWSITAVDSIVSQNLIARMKEYPTIDEFRVYKLSHMDNRFAAILMPESWSFEWIEAWFPGTTWNPETAPEPAVMGDHETYEGRTAYPDIGGCYYACRLAVAEALVRERRQASALVLREIHPGYLLPVGVWFVRESVRRMLAQRPEVFHDLRSALESAVSGLTIPVSRWVDASWLLRRSLFQKKITEFWQNGRVLKREV